MNSFWIFLTASLAVIIVPGPDMIFILTRGVSGGSGRAVMAATGVGTGLLTHTLALALGLSVVLQSFPGIYTLIRILGGFYLVYLGIASVRSRKVLELETGDSVFSPARCFLQGYISNLLNPKIVLFFLAFLPQFVSGTTGDSRLQLAGKGLVFSGLTIFLYSLLGYFSGRIGTQLVRSYRGLIVVRSISGIVLILLGLGMLIN